MSNVPAARLTPSPVGVLPACTPIPAELALIPWTPKFRPLVALADPKTPVPPTVCPNTPAAKQHVPDELLPLTPLPFGLASRPATPLVLPLVAVALPTTPFPDVLGVLPLTPLT